MISLSNIILSTWLPSRFCCSPQLFPHSPPPPLPSSYPPFPSVTFLFAPYFPHFLYYISSSHPPTTVIYPPPPFPCSLFLPLPSSALCSPALPFSPSSPPYPSHHLPSLFTLPESHLCSPSLLYPPCSPTTLLPAPCSTSPPAQCSSCLASLSSLAVLISSRFLASTYSRYVRYPSPSMSSSPITVSTMSAREHD